MAMTFLQLSSRLRQEVGGAGTGPSAVTGQVGEYGRIVSWIATSDEEVQQEHDEWKFMVGSFTINTVADDGAYAPADFVTPVTDLRNYRMETLKIYLSATGVSDETPLYYMDYQEWYEIYNTGTQTSGRPKHFTIDNDMDLLLGPAPSAVYRVSGEYQKSVDTLATNSDTPIYPAEYHMLPVYLGMMKFGRYTGAAEVYADGERLYKKLLRRMERTQLPRIRTAGPLA
jgi:hypothetical protein